MNQTWFLFLTSCLASGLCRVLVSVRANGKVMLSPSSSVNQSKSCRQAGLPAQFLMNKKQEERWFKGRSKIYGGRWWFSSSTGLH